MKTLKLFLLIIITFLSACNETPVKLTNVPQPDAKKTITEPIIIDIQPYSDIAKKYVDHVFSELSKIYPNITIKEPIPLPGTAYYKKRNRYRADSLINDLRQTTPKGHVTIGMTSKDISDTKGNVQDYGIMGLGYQPGSACVVSYFRLSKENVMQQFFKLAIHELGHTQGLPHCPERTCFMRDAEGKNHADEEKEFCPKCKVYLETKGWVFKNS